MIETMIQDDILRSTTRVLNASRRPLVSLLLSATLFPLVNMLLSLAARDTLPLFLDSIFTAIAAAIFGPWHGLLVAVLTNGFYEAFEGFPGLYFPYAVCGAATALIVWAFVRSGRYRSALAWGLCVGAVTLANALLGGLIASYVYGGATGMNFDNIVAGFALFTDSVFTAAFLARLPINLVDKTLAVAPAFALAAMIAKSEKKE
ncbi:MAG: ECF transporter S component [Spirochaetae bacterium HGW-Spirochaetae-7]|nr:MAG: ECF transporter S component [Spirochaetae bacterium HGW-Spirochaetae-7]